MGVIKSLDYNVVVKIAAGEVIERPASVVRELIDNSIDAGAKSISIHISNGGKGIIEIQDDGIGMEKDDLQLCYKNHTTSKISKFEDIYSINTLGFRGEALSSIAEVSELIIHSKYKFSNSAYKIEINFGEFVLLQEVPRNYGTTVIVKNLFKNIPARLKFLSSSSTEVKYIEKEITKKALAFPEISFEMYVDGKRKYLLTSKNSLIERIADFFPDVVNYLLPVNYIDDDLNIIGFISKSSFYRPNRLYQYFFVNNRPVEWKNFYLAVNNSYGNLIPKGYFPALFIYLKIKPDLVDVNVHPTKKEVKFKDEQKITNILTSIINDALINDTGYAPFENNEVKFTPYEKRISEAISEYYISNRNFNDGKKYYNFTNNQTNTKVDLFNVSKDIKSKKSLISYRFVGIVFQTYIIMEDEEELLFLDQHAAHERINYEKFKNKYNNSIIDKQPLLIPVKIEVPLNLVDYFQENLNILNSMGFEIDYFGGTTFIVQSAPDYIDYNDIESVIEGFIETIEENINIKQKPSDFIDSAIKQMACKSSTKAGDNLSRDEVYELLKNLENTSNYYSCPHGRPIIFSISKKDLEKNFKRDGF